MPTERKYKTFTIEDAKLIYRNFSGRPTMYKKDESKQFSVILDETLAQQMLADGWNVKFKEPRSEEEDGFWHISVAVSFENRPPRVTMITSKSKVRTLLTDSIIEILDIVELETVDLTCRGYDWEVNGKSGTKAYLQTMYVKIWEDDLDVKWAQQDEAPVYDEED